MKERKEIALMYQGTKKCKKNKKMKNIKYSSISLANQKTDKRNLPTAPGQMRNYYKPNRRTVKNPRHNISNRICKHDPHCKGFTIPGTNRIVPCKFRHPVRDFKRP